MTTKTILGISLAVVFVISMITFAYATTPGYLIITDATSDGTKDTMTLQDSVKEIPAKKAEGVITFWAWAINTPGNAPEGTALAVDAITIHHGVNDHQAFGKAARSTPVQSFHPHRAYFDSANCVIGLESPKADFRVKDNTVTLASSDIAAVAATGTIGPREECTATGLGVTSANFFTIP